VKKAIIKWLIRHWLKGYSLHRNPVRRKRDKIPAIKDIAQVAGFLEGGGNCHEKEMQNRGDLPERQGN